MCVFLQKIQAYIQILIYKNLQKNTVKLCEIYLI